MQTDMHTFTTHKHADYKVYKMKISRSDTIYIVTLNKKYVKIKKKNEQKVNSK